MTGPPGTGKSMLARCLPGIMPPLTPEEALEVTMIYSVAGRLTEEDGLITERPFIAPHHSVTKAALIGG
jgi:magnesium chelatase family protein